jgi:hypothetical protein
MELLFWIVLVGAPIVLLAGGCLVLLRGRSTREEPVCNFLCPHCERKLRYRGQKAGKAGICPLCRRPLTYPSPTSTPGRIRG